MLFDALSDLVSLPAMFASRPIGNRAVLIVDGDGLEGTDETAMIGRRLFRREIRLLYTISPAAHRDPNHMLLAR
uniref:Uncharacterized protein n=1 Tax=Arundo donax TaxID=35708 RepID=A0A0A9FL05_ARUDO